MDNQSSVPSGATPTPGNNQPARRSRSYSALQPNRTGGAPYQGSRPNNPGAPRRQFTNNAPRPGGGAPRPHTPGAPASSAPRPAGAPRPAYQGSRTGSTGAPSAAGTPRRTGAGTRTGGAPRSGGRGGPNRHVRQTFRARPPEASSQSGDNENEQVKAEKKIPALGAGNIRIIPLGGVEEVGRNMTAIEYGNDIVIIDCGFQFHEEETPGIDYILPNTKYLEDRKDKIKAMVITHGHLDHIGGIPFVIDGIGYPPLYTRRLTAVMIKKRQEEFPHLKPLTIHEVETTDSILLGDIRLKFFAVSHTIPDSMGVIIDTPHGWVVATGDLKLDHQNGVPSKEEEKSFALFNDKKVLLLMADSTNVEKPGFSTPESVVRKNIAEIISNATGRLFIGTFSSQLERAMQLIEHSASIGKKILVEGRSMKTNIEIVRHLGMLKVPDNTFISPTELEGVPDSKLIILATGSQGEEFGALMRMATKSHKFIQFKKGDVVMLSSSVVPGNERAVQKLKDNLSRQGAKIIDRGMADIHSSGHANRDETVWIHQHIKPKFFMPMHGYHYMLSTHAEIARACGLGENDVVIPDNGTVIEIQEEGTKLVRLKETAPNSLRLVDGFSIGDIQEVVIRDRKMLAAEGMFVIIATVNHQTGQLRKSPDIISRGFVYLRENQELLQQARIVVKKTIEETTKGMNPINFDFVKNNVTDAVARFLFEKTNKRPIVIPVVLGV